MNKYCRMVIIGFGIALFGCAPMRWEKSGSSEQDLARDKFECERASTVVVQPKPYVAPQPQMVGNQYIAPHWTSQLAATIDSAGGSYVNDNLFESCMAAKGYYKARAKK